MTVLQLRENEQNRGKESQRNVEAGMEANDAGAMCKLVNYYCNGHGRLLHDREKTIGLRKHAAELGSSEAHLCLANVYYEGGDLKKAKFHFEVAAMAGNEVARNRLGFMEEESGNIERAVKHFIIAASTGSYQAMIILITCFQGDFVSRESIDSILTAYNSSYAEMRSEAQDASIQWYIDISGGE